MNPLLLAAFIVIGGIVLTGLIVAVLVLERLMKGDIWHE